MKFFLRNIILENSPKSNISRKELTTKILACAPHHYSTERDGGLLEEWWSGTQAKKSYLGKVSKYALLQSKIF